MTDKRRETDVAVEDQQVGGDHYKKAFVVEPLEYCMVNNIPFMEGNIIKYVSRWRLKGGLEDLKKAQHYLDWLVEHVERTQGLEEMENELANIGADPNV